MPTGSVARKDWAKAALWAWCERDCPAALTITSPWTWFRTARRSPSSRQHAASSCATQNHEEPDTYHNHILNIDIIIYNEYCILNYAFNAHHPICIGYHRVCVMVVWRHGWLMLLHVDIVCVRELIAVCSSCHAYYIAVMEKFNQL